MVWLYRLGTPMQPRVAGLEQLLPLSAGITNVKCVLSYPARVFKKFKPIYYDSILMTVTTTNG